LPVSLDGMPSAVLTTLQHPHLLEVPVPQLVTLRWETYETLNYKGAGLPAWRTVEGSPPSLAGQGRWAVAR